MDDSSTSQSSDPRPTWADWVFIVLIFLALSSVAYLGKAAYDAAHKTEISKRQGEHLAAWLRGASPERFKPDFQTKSCAGGKTTIEATTDRTWGACLARLLKVEFKGHTNPFNSQTPRFVSACDLTNKELSGAIVLEKLSPAAAGSAVAIANSQLLDADSIAEKLQLRIGICDRGADLIHISELQF